MATEGVMNYETGEVKYTTPVALTNGQVIQAKDGRAAVYGGLKAAAVNDWVILFTKGIRTVQKNITNVFLAGQEVWWDVANNKAVYRLAGDFFVGLAVDDAAYTATTLRVDMNVKPYYPIALNDGNWAHAAALGLGATNEPGGIVKLSFDAVAEVAMAALYSSKTIALAKKPIFEAEVAIFDIGDDAALDISIGVANANHATDMDAATETCLLHFDGSDLDMLFESDDGTTEVAATTTATDAVDDTYFFLQIDMRSLADIQVYVNGVNYLPATVFKLDAATGPILALANIEKTSNDTVADVRIRQMTLRSAVTG